MILLFTNLFLLAGIGTTIANYSTSQLEGQATYTDLIISEYYEGAAGNNKAIEIFNGTGSSINLANYSLVQYSNGVSTVSSYVNLTGTISNLSTITIYHSGTARISIAGTKLSSDAVINFNGDDTLVLYNNGGSPLSGTSGATGTVNSDMSDETVVDIIGAIGQDGTNGSAFLFTSANNSVTTGSTLDRILVRNRLTTSPNSTFTGSEWLAFPVSFTSVALSPGLTEPDSKTTSFGSHSSSTLDLIYAENYAYLFLNGTANKTANCTDAGLNWTSSLETNFNSLTANEKSAFTNNTNNSSNITNALARYNYLRTYTPSLSNFAGI